MFSRWSFVLSACVLGIGLSVVLSAGQRNNLGSPEPGSRGRKARGDIETPVPGALHGSAAVDALNDDLGQRVREHGGSPDDYAALLSSDGSAWISADGQLMFVDVAEHEAEPGPGAGDAPADSTAPTGPPPTPLFLLPNGMPIHHSKPGAPWTIYLDFDGEPSFRSSSWGTISPRRITGLTLDADATTFNADEQALISRMWGRVAEDWVPFDVDVTTERPAVIGFSVLWSIIGKSPAEIGMPSSVGGVSLFNLGGYVPFGLQNPTFTFWQPFGASDHSTLADVITQENGHMFGLLHDGFVRDTGGITEYYGGHGTGPTSWGPVMGAPLDRNVTQWSRGDYPGAVTVFGGFQSVVQDDIALIAGKLGFRADDFADTIAGAAPLAQPTAGYITSTTDVDVFALPLANEVHIEVTPFRAGELTDGGNLDVAADILNASGAVVASVDDVNETAAAITVDLPLTQHYLRVRPSFDPANYPAYASLGGYTVTGTFVRSVKLLDFQEPLSSSIVTPGRTLPVKFTLSDAVAAARVLLLPAPLATPADALAEALCKAQQNSRQHCSVRVPGALVPGETYWLLVQHQDKDGSWVTARAAAGGSAQNPLPIVVN